MRIRLLKRPPSTNRIIGEVNTQIAVILGKAFSLTLPEYIAELQNVKKHSLLKIAYSEFENFVKNHPVQLGLVALGIAGFFAAVGILIAFFATGGAILVIPAAVAGGTIAFNAVAGASTLCASFMVPVFNALIAVIGPSIAGSTLAATITGTGLATLMGTLIVLLPLYLGNTWKGMASWVSWFSDLMKGDGGQPPAGGHTLGAGSLSPSGARTATLGGTSPGPGGNGNNNNNNLGGAINTTATTTAATTTFTPIKLDDPTDHTDSTQKLKLVESSSDSSDDDTSSDAEKPKDLSGGTNTSTTPSQPPATPPVQQPLPAVHPSPLQQQPPVVQTQQPTPPAQQPDPAAVPIPVPGLGTSGTAT